MNNINLFEQYKPNFSILSKYISEIMILIVNVSIIKNVKMGNIRCAAVIWSGSILVGHFNAMSLSRSYIAEGKTV